MTPPRGENKKRTDIYSKQKRSRIMGLIKGKDTLLEIRFSEILKKAGLKFSRNVKTLPGKPDFVFRRKKIAIFVDGCFWHGCKQHFKLPQSNQWFWREKIDKNVKRDSQINKFYREHGWTVLRIWQHDVVKKSRKINALLRKIDPQLKIPNRK